MKKIKLIKKRFVNQLPVKQLPVVLNVENLIHSLKNEFSFIKVFLLHLDNQEQFEHVMLFAKHKGACIEALDTIEKIIKQLEIICSDHVKGDF